MTTGAMRLALLAAACAAAAAMAAEGGAGAATAAVPKGGEKARSEALAIGKFTLVDRPAKAFGDVEPRKDAVVHRGETMNFYAEPKHLANPRSAAGVYEPAFEVDVEIRKPDGNTIKQDKFATIRLPSKRPQDVYVNLTLALSQVPPGKYNVKFVFRDLNSKKVGAAAMDVAIN